MEEACKIGPDGRLAATRQVILNQLTVGERVESPGATQLPVLLAVARLKDRNGAIDINLPISGSLSDPQFSTGNWVWTLILNLLGRALTAPFALLASGGTDDLSPLEFASGSARVREAGQPSRRPSPALPTPPPHRTRPRPQHRRTWPPAQDALPAGQPAQHTTQCAGPAACAACRRDAGPAAGRRAGDRQARATWRCSAAWLAQCADRPWPAQRAPGSGRPQAARSGRGRRGLDTPGAADAVLPAGPGQGRPAPTCVGLRQPDRAAAAGPL